MSADQASPTAKGSRPRADKAMRHARERIRALTRLTSKWPFSVIVEDLNLFLRGWAAYFRFGHSHRQFAKIRFYAAERLALLIARRHTRDRLYGWRMLALLHDEDYTIVATYGSEYRGFVQYYLLAQDVFRLEKLRWVMETSMLKTLAGKHKSTVTKMARKHKASLDTVDGPRTCFQVTVQRDRGRKPLVVRFGGIPLTRKRTAVVTDLKPVMATAKRNELIRRLLAGRCESCEGRIGLQVHHIRKLAYLNKPGRPDRPPWVQLMAMRKRKTLVVCEACHQSIHAGRVTATTRK